MNEREFQDKLADYLAGEMNAAEAEAFRAALAADPERRRLADELQAAAAALECRAASDEEAREATAGLRWDDLAARARRTPVRAERPASRLRILNVALRYAAAIVLAFVAGYWARSSAAVAEREPAPIVRGPEIGSVGTEAAEQYAASYVKAARSFPNASSFSRTLMALAKSGR